MAETGGVSEPSPMDYEDQQHHTPPALDPETSDVVHVPNLLRRQSSGTRGRRCGECPACKIKENCGVCDYCKDMPKFGGPGKLKQACRKRKCMNLVRRGSKRNLKLEDTWSRRESDNSGGASSSTPQSCEGPSGSQTDSPQGGPDLIETERQKRLGQRKLLERALRHGSFKIRITKCLANGPPGVGKTCFIQLMLDKECPEVRNSTGILEQADGMCVRPIRIDTVCVGGSKWERLGYEQKVKMVAKATRLPSDSESGDQIEEAEEELLQRTTEEFSRIVLPTLAVSKKGEIQNHDMQWVYFMDSGGQPQFLEILPAFVRNTSVNLAVFKLSEELERQIRFEHVVNGIHSRKKWLEVTSEQMIEQTARTLLSCKYSYPLCLEGLGAFTVHKSPSQPKMMLIGTYKDQAHKCRETPEDKEEKLLNNPYLKPTIESEEDIHHSMLIESKDEKFIFQIDASKEGWSTNKETIDDIRECILNSECLEVDIPSRWYWLQLNLTQEVETTNLKVITIEKCIVEGRSLGMSEEEVYGALKYFNELNIFLYYPKVLPDIVFCDPQVLVKRISDIIAASFSGSKHAYPDVKPPVRRKLHGKGEFTAELLELSSFQNKKEHSLFTSEDFIKLLEHLFIIAKTGKIVAVKGESGEKCNIPVYFIPCVLPRVRVDTEQRRSKWSRRYTHVDPYLIYFPDGWSPRGLFCALIVSLTSINDPLHWTITTNRQKSSPSRNLIEFTGPTFHGTVIIVDAMTWFEIHSTCHPSECADIRTRILKKIDEVLPNFFYDEVQYKDAFVCSEKCGHHYRHAAIVTHSDSRNCTVDTGYWQFLDPGKQRVWLSAESDNEGPSCKRPRLSTDAITAGTPAETTQQQQIGGHDNVQIILQGSDTDDELPTFSSLPKSKAPRLGSGKTSSSEVGDPASRDELANGKEAKRRSAMEEKRKAVIARKAERERQRNEKKHQKEMDKAFKKVTSEANKENSPSERVKQMIVILDTVLSESGDFMVDLVGELRDMGVEYRVGRGEVHPGSVRWKRRVSERTVGNDTQVWGGLQDGEVHPGSVRWKRRVSERTVGDDTQIVCNVREKDENQVLVTLPVQGFVALVHYTKQAQCGVPLPPGVQTLQQYVDGLQMEHPPGMTITLAVEGLDVFFRWVKIGLLSQRIMLPPKRTELRQGKEDSV